MQGNHKRGLNHETNVVAASDPTSVKFELETIFEPVVQFLPSQSEQRLEIEMAMFAARSIIYDKNLKYSQRQYYWLVCVMG